MEVGAAKLCPHNAVGWGCVTDPNMRNVPLAEKRTDIIAHDPLLRLCADNVCFE